jgi:hypothetical protein
MAKGGTLHDALIDVAAEAAHPQEEDEEAPPTRSRKNITIRSAAKSSRRR